MSILSASVINKNNFVFYCRLGKCFLFVECPVCLVCLGTFRSVVISSIHLPLGLGDICFSAYYLSVVKLVDTKGQQSTKASLFSESATRKLTIIVIIDGSVVPCSTEANFDAHVFFLNYSSSLFFVFINFIKSGRWRPSWKDSLYATQKRRC